MLRRQVLLHERLQTGASRRQLPERRGLSAELFADHRGHEVVLGVKVSVEGAVGKAGVGHQRGDARAVDPVLLEPTAGGLDDPPPGRVLVLLAVPRHQNASPFLDLVVALSPIVAHGLMTVIVGSTDNSPAIPANHPLHFTFRPIHWVVYLRSG